MSDKYNAENIKEFETWFDEDKKKVKKLFKSFKKQDKVDSGKHSIKLIDKAIKLGLVRKDDDGMLIDKKEEWVTEEWCELECWVNNIAKRPVKPVKLDLTNIIKQYLKKEKEVQE